jgi:hypothetical protein
MDAAPRSTMAGRLRSARRRRFVGRAGELELVQAALEAPELPFAVLFLHGPGGVGKSSLLGRILDAAADAGVPAWRIDLRGIEISPRGVQAALAGAMGVPGPAAALEALQSGGRRVLALDTFEAIGGHEGWLREQLLPELGEDVLVVIAGRDAPSPDWLGDAGWRELLRAVSLRNLAPDDARALLRAEGVAERLHDRFLAATHGHPLALALLVDVIGQRDVDGEGELRLADSPDVVRALLERFVASVPSDRHRAALEACAHVRVTTEALLRDALGTPDAAEAFAWLRGLSFVEEAADGLLCHDLARDVLDADLRWRDPAGYVAQHRRIRRHVLQRIRTTDGREQQRASADLHFLHRGNPGIAPFYDWETLGKGYAEGLRDGDAEHLLAMVERHESPESAGYARFWLARRPDAFSVFRAGTGDAPIGFAVALPLHELDPADVDADPATRAIASWVLANGPPRPGEEVYAGRFFMDAIAYQAPSPSLNIIAIVSVQRWVDRPRLAWDFTGPWADPAAIAPMMRHIDYHPAAGADIELAGRRYGFFAHDWRAAPLEPWFEMMGSRELAAGPPEPAAGPAPAALALSQPDFADAVRRGLRDLHRPGALAANPLSSARLVRDRDGAGAPAEALEAILREAVAAVGADPRDEKLQRVLDRTFVRPAPTQERAAELLDLPWSTYRRHLARGVERVTEWLWQRELYGR